MRSHTISEVLQQYLDELYTGVHGWVLCEDALQVGACQLHCDVLLVYIAQHVRSKLLHSSLTAAWQTRLEAVASGSAAEAAQSIYQLLTVAGRLLEVCFLQWKPSDHLRARCPHNFLTHVAGNFCAESCSTNL